MTVQLDRFEWAYRCRTCHKSVSYGAAKLRAEIEGGKHARKYDWHVVEITATLVTHRFTARDNINKLDDSNEIPF